MSFDAAGMAPREIAPGLSNEEAKLYVIGFLGLRMRSDADFEAVALVMATWWLEVQGLDALAREDGDRLLRLLRRHCAHLRHAVGEHFRGEPPAWALEAVRGRR